MNGQEFLELESSLSKSQMKQTVTVYFKSTDEYHPIDRACTYREMFDSVKRVVKGGLIAPLIVRVDNVPVSVEGVHEVPSDCDVLDPDHIVLHAKEGDIPPYTHNVSVYFCTH